MERKIALVSFLPSFPSPLNMQPAPALCFCSVALLSSFPVYTLSLTQCSTRSKKSVLPATAKSVGFLALLSAKNQFLNFSSSCFTLGLILRGSLRSLARGAHFLSCERKCPWKCFEPFPRSFGKINSCVCAVHIDQLQTLHLLLIFICPRSLPVTVHMQMQPQQLVL